MQEIEAKFYVQDLKKIESRIHELDARLIQPRVFEMNIRFDLPGGGLRSKGQVLRLRQDAEARLTYKNAGTKIDGIINRTEIEFTVDDFDKAKLFLEALGYQKMLEYDKYRTTYDLDSDRELSESRKQASGPQSCHIMLDELPFGNFIEIEGETLEAIHSVSDQLNLNWSTAVTRGYSDLFQSVRQILNLSFSDLTFTNFNGITVSPEDLQVQPADD